MDVDTLELPNPHVNALHKLVDQLLQTLLHSHNQPTITDLWNEAVTMDVSRSAIQDITLLPCLNPQKWLLFYQLVFLVVLVYQS